MTDNNIILNKSQFLLFEKKLEIKSFFFSYETQSFIICIPFIIFIKLLLSYKINLFFTYTSNISLTSLIIQALKIFIPISNCIVYRSDIVAFIDDSITEKLFHNKNLEFEIFLKFNNLSAGISQKFSNLSVMAKVMRSCRNAVTRCINGL